MFCNQYEKYFNKKKFSYSFNQIKETFAMNLRLNRNMVKAG